MIQLVIFHPQESNMKKIFIISILFVTSFLFFTGCGHTTGATNVTGSADTTPLFDESEAPITIDSLALSDLSDGTWEYKFVYVYTYSTPHGETIYLPGGGTVGCNVNSWAWFHSLTFTKSGSTITVTSGTKTNVYTMDDANKAIVNTYAANQGESLTWDGNTLTITRSTSSDYMITSMFEDSEQDYYITKKNTAGTRFIVKPNYSPSSGQNIQYLKKLD